MKLVVRCYYWREDRPLVNLGDLLVPHLLDALGYACAPRQVDDSLVVNPGRCLLVIGSLLTRGDLEKIACPVDVWGCGWKGADLAPSGQEDARFFAVRGPLTAAGLRLPPGVALGDPALLLPQLVPTTIQPHGRAIVIPHCFRLAAMRGSARLRQTGCDEVVSPMVFRAPWPRALRALPPSGVARLLSGRLRFGIRTLDLWQAVGRIAGAGFVLTGSLHGAILAQAYGVPWAAYDDGYIDAPAKWIDWAAYLGIEIEVVGTLAQGQRWWQKYGSRGRVRDLGRLLSAFPYPILDPAARALAQMADWPGTASSSNVTRQQYS